jgi:hypothetical protein
METMGDEAVRGDAVGERTGTAERRRATLRRGAASLTATAHRARFEQHGRAAGEGAP